jgi:hypothetical protein
MSFGSVCRQCANSHRPEKRRTLGWRFPAWSPARGEFRRQASHLSSAEDVACRLRSCCRELSSPFQTDQWSDQRRPLRSAARALVLAAIRAAAYTVVQFGLLRATTKSRFFSSGQESNQTTWRLCKMNLAIRGIESNIAWNSEGSFHNDAHKDLKADFILANPPFNDSDWGGESLEKMFVGNMAFRPLAMPTLLGFSTSSSSCAQRGRRVRSGQRLASCS